MNISQNSQDITEHEPLPALRGVPCGAIAYALRRLIEGEIPGREPSPLVVHVAVNDRAMDQLEHVISYFMPGVTVLRLPAWDCLPYDRVSPRLALVSERVEALAELAMRDPKTTHPLVVLTTVSALMQKVPPVSSFRDAVLKIEAGKDISRDALIAFLAENGFRRSGKAIEPGEYAVRGGIIDIVPPGESEGVRLDFFGDEIESMKRFDPMTQVSNETAKQLVLHPAGELRITEASVERFRSAYREQFGAVNKEDPLYESVSAGQHYPGVEHWLPLFYDSMSTLTDYLPGALITLDAEAEKSIEERHETIRDYYGARVEAMNMKSVQGVPYKALPPETLYIMEREWERMREAKDLLVLNTFDDGKGNSLRCRPAPSLVAARAGSSINPFEQLKEVAAGQRYLGRGTVLACLSVGSRERIATLLTHAGVHSVKIEHWPARKDVKGKSIGLSALPLENGFESEDTLLLSEQDLLGERIIRAKPKRKQSEVFLAEAANFTEGEIVVHKEHGIGRFEGLVTLEVQGAQHDCLKLLYADDDRLFLPVENIELVTRFGAEDDEIRLDKLGAASWQARKARMKERIRLAAEELMKVAAERQLKHAPVMEAPADIYDEFSSRFGFVETEDQERSIDDVLEDLANGRPMDRLVCGDVGFGKTEVALRAAFVAATATPKKQVALIVPTTLLARQHFRNFCERFEGFGLTVRQLSRMVPVKQQKETLEGLKEGTVDIVIGTHALLAKGVEFKRLGLVIVDEEQHFGVAQKERLKQLKADVHVLTLSATPIPRTLQLALTGVRSLSLITTPPVDRLAVRSFVMPWDGVVMREAIMRELHRGGRVFFVCPRIKDIAEVKVKLAELVPEAKMAVGHGQMTPKELDTIMTDFSDGKINLLLSTAIVESGLDIPEANTMLVYRADRFGLAQLYQLRGRVGRGKLRAYAYFLLPPSGRLTDTGMKRLEVMQSLDTLGAGFTLASHDMDIRGFGNLVGEEQSGHIREVGIELYQQMLEDAVQAAREKQKGEIPGEAEEEWSPQINLGVSVLIPETYVEDLSLRMGLYRRAAGLKTPEEIESFAAELVDRFGPIPNEVENLLMTVRMKQLCRAAGVSRIDAGPKGVVISFHMDRFAKPDALLGYIARKPTQIKLRPDQKLVLMYSGDDKAAQRERVEALLKEIIDLI